MIKIALCDDDMEDLEKYREKIGKYLERVQSNDSVMIHEYVSGEALQFKIHEGEISDIYILDIEMGEEKMSGLELAQKINQIQQDAIIIFLTNHKKYALRGYHYRVLRYISKMNSEKTLPEALDEAVRLCKRKNHKFLTCRYYNEYIRVSHDEIMCVYKIGQYSEITLKDQKVIREKTGIEKLYNNLADERFVWVDRKSFINLDYLKRINEGRVILTDGSSHETSKAKLKVLQDILFAQWSNERGKK